MIESARLAVRLLPAVRTCTRSLARKGASRSEKMAQCDQRPPLPKQRFAYLLIVDLEATCDASTLPEPQEVIEFPCLKFNTRTLKVEGKFHEYVRPDVHPNLTAFCTQLTGIVQEMVDDRPNLLTTLGAFDEWLRREDLLEDGQLKLAAFATCGDWDFGSLLMRQCRHLGVEMPSYMRKWVNVKAMFFEEMKVWPKGMRHMLEVMKMRAEGRVHSGVDDAANIARIVAYLIEKGRVVEETSKLA